MTKYRRLRLKKQESKQSKKLSMIEGLPITLLILTGLIVSLTGCKSLELCHGKQVCEWQEVAPIVCPEKQKIPTELLKTLRLQPELDVLLSTPKP